MKRNSFGRWWSVAAFGILFAEAKAPAAENAQAAASDEVLLKDGSSFRGTIAESVPGDYLVLVTLSGRTLRFPAGQVEYSGPIGRRPAEEAPPGRDGLAARLEVTGRQVPLRFESPQPGVSLFVHSHTSQGSAWSENGSVYATVNGYTRVCAAPCEARLTEGTYRMGLSSGGAVLDTGYIDIKEQQVLEGKIEDRSPLRTAGWALFAISMLGGSVMMALSIDDETLEVNDGLLIGGSLLMGLGSLAAYFLATAPDRAELKPRPAGP